MKHIVLAGFAAALALSACDQVERVNPPTEPAPPVPVPVTPPAVIPGVTPTQPGSGPANFVGIWAADPAWCANPTGPQRPIRVSATRFEGYENLCEITSVTEAPNAYVVGVACQSEGTTTNERLSLAATATTLRITWLDRDQTSTEFTRCPAP